MPRRKHNDGDASIRRELALQRVRYMSWVDDENAILKRLTVDELAALPPARLLEMADKCPPSDPFSASACRILAGVVEV